MVSNKHHVLGLQNLVQQLDILVSLLALNTLYPDN